MSNDSRPQNHNLIRATAANTTTGMSASSLVRQERKNKREINSNIKISASLCDLQSQKKGRSTRDKIHMVRWISDDLMHKIHFYNSQPIGGRKGLIFPPATSIHKALDELLSELKLWHSKEYPVARKLNW